MSEDEEALDADEINDLTNEVLNGLTTLLSNGYTRKDLEDLIDAAEMNV